MDLIGLEGFKETICTLDHTRASVRCDSHPSDVEFGRDEVQLIHQHTPEVAAQGLVLE